MHGASATLQAPALSSQAEAASTRGRGTLFFLLSCGGDDKPASRAAGRASCGGAENVHTAHGRRPLRLISFCLCEAQRDPDIRQQMHSHAEPVAKDSYHEPDAGHGFDLGAHSVLTYHMRTLGRAINPFPKEEH